MKNSFPLQSQRGSVLIVAMLLAAVIAISLTSYIKLSLNSMTLANRTFYSNAALNLAETGIEEAAWSFNQANAGSTTSWTTSPWVISGATAHATFTGFTFGANTTGVVKVYVDNYNPSGSTQPTAVAKATITLPNSQGEVSKYVQVKLRRRSLFATGLVAKNSIEFRGNNASVDSWNSVKNSDGTARASAVGYSSSVMRDHGSVGTVTVTSTVDVQNADIYGTVSVGGTSSSAISVGSQGRVGPFGTGAGVKNADSIATDFSADIDVQTAPTTGTTISSISGTTTLGTAGATTTWRAPSMDGKVTIQGNVTLVLTAAAGSSAISMTGQEYITLASGASLTIYTAGDISIAGNGVLNSSTKAIDFAIYGTSTSSTAQDIKIAGNGYLNGVVYAPNANVTINGNGDVMGSVVGNTITMTGNAAFHYDESLADQGASNPYKVDQWYELVTPTERIPSNSAYPAYGLSTF